MHKAQRLINHVALVLDGSGSMNKHKNKLITVADEQIRHLALRSEEMSQETRVTVYLFDDAVQCLIFDMDVMRLPSIADLYNVRGMTALIDATVKSQDDLATTSQLYGDHAFLTFVLTDGQENASRNRSSSLTTLVNRMKENWSLAFLVPDRSGTAYLTRLGVNDGNIAIWDAVSADGVVSAANTIRAATDNFMTARASGVRGTRNVFSTGVDVVNDTSVKSSLTPLPLNTYNLFRVPSKTRIDEFVNGQGINYRIGIGYYELTKTETIQPQKEVVVVDRATGQAYVGKDARGLIGLPDGMAVRVRPDANPKYQIFIQSTSVNRNLMPNTNVLVRK